MQENWVQSLGWEDPLEKGMAPRSSILAWRIPWTEEPGGLQSMGLQRWLSDFHFTHTSHRKENVYEYSLYSDPISNKFISSMYIYKKQSRSEFLSLYTFAVRNWIVLCYGECLMHCMVFRSILGLYPLDVRSIVSPHLRCDNQKCLQTLSRVVVGGQEHHHPDWEHWPKQTR